MHKLKLYVNIHNSWPGQLTPPFCNWLVLPCKHTPTCYWFILSNTHSTRTELWGVTDGWLNSYGLKDQHKVCSYYNQINGKSLVDWTEWTVHLHVCAGKPQCTLTDGVIKYGRSSELTHFLSTSYNGLKHQNNPWVTCPASQSPEKMLTPNIGFYDSHISSWCLVSGSFSAVNKHLKQADKACMKFQERETSPDFFS